MARRSYLGLRSKVGTSQMPSLSTPFAATFFLSYFRLYFLLPFHFLYIVLHFLTYFLLYLWFILLCLRPICVTSYGTPSLCSVLYFTSCSLPF